MTIQRNGKIFHALGWEELYYYNGYYTQSNLQIQCEPYQVTNDNFQRTRANNLKIYMKTLKTQNCQSTPEEKEQSRRHNPPRHHTIPQSYSDQNSMILAQKTDIWVSGTEQRTHK